MAQKIILAQMKQRRDTNARWESVNPVLAEGEIGVITDKPGYFKIGNGADAWNDLPMAGGGAASGMVNVTYDELVELRGNKKLIPGCKYRIIDYQTHVNHSLLSTTDVRFDVVVIALSEDTLSESAEAMYPLRRTPGSGNISKSRFEGWRLGYRLDNDTYNFSWAHEYGRGVIFHMVDEWENEAFFDFKSLMIAHDDGNFYFTFGGSVDRSSVGTMQGNYIGPKSMFNIIISSYGSSRIGTMSSNNFINGQRVTIGDYSRANNIEGDDVTLAGNCNYNNIKGPIITLGSNSSNNTLTGNYIRLGHQCNANQISATNVEFSDDCSGNRLESLCERIKFGTQCFNNRIVESTDVTIGNDTSGSVVHYSDKTKIGSRCSGISLYDGEGNQIGDDCSDISLRSAFKEDGTTVRANSSYNQIGVRNTDINLIGAQNTIIGNDNSDVTVGGTEDGSHIAATTTENRIGSNNSTVSIYSGCSRNVVEDNVNNVVIGAPFDTVTSDELEYFLRNSHNNHIGSGSQYVSIGIEAYENVIGENSSTVTVGYGSIANRLTGSYIVLGEDCIGNMVRQAGDIKIGNEGSQNIVETGCQTIYLDASCSRNTFGPGCSGIRLGANNTNNSFGSGCMNITTGLYYNRNIYKSSSRANFVLSSDTSKIRDKVELCVLPPIREGALKLKCPNTTTFITSYVIHPINVSPDFELIADSVTERHIYQDNEYNAHDVSFPEIVSGS